jgi:DNA-binding IclR family transcriptional regulator
MVERRAPSSRGRPGGSARAVERTLEILLVFLREGRGLRIVELSRAARLPKATVHRLVTTLVGRGFLTRDAHDSTYRVGLNLFRLGGLFLAQNGARQAALPLIRDLSGQTGETVNLNVVIDRHRVCIEKAESTHDIRHFVELGRPLPLYGGASGMVLLAHLDEAEIEAVMADGLRPLTPRTITSANRLRRALAEIRRRGYATSTDERVVGASAVSAPVRDGSGRVVAGLTISGPTYRFTPERGRRYVELVRAGAARVSEALGYEAVTETRLPARRQLRRASLVR